jgi:F-type H+/Na+-transporting ATPase subunit beta
MENTTVASNSTTVSTGQVAQIIGPVIDADFTGTKVPDILDALEIDGPAGTLVLEVQQHLGESRIRAIAMDSTDGVTRGTAVRNTGRPIAMPVGPEVRGRLFNVVGKAIDGLPQPTAEGYRPIHADPPPFDELAASIEMLETGIKVIDLVQPVARGGKVGLFGAPASARRCSSWS